MSRLVEVEFILNECDEFTLEGDTLKSISGNSTPSIDIVRCKDCRYRYVYGKGVTRYYICDFLDAENRDDGFCSYGERRA